MSCVLVVRVPLYPPYIGIYVPIWGYGYPLHAHPELSGDMLWMAIEQSVAARYTMDHFL